MSISVFDLFKVGIGPSSSHTTGPMRAGLMFARALADAGLLERVSGLRVELFGSLAATGVGHGTPAAVILGLGGAQPETVEPEAAAASVAATGEAQRLRLLGTHPISFDPARDIVLVRRDRLPRHPNGMRFSAMAGAELLHRAEYYSVGGGFVLGPDDSADAAAGARPEPYPFRTAADLLAACARTDLPISGLVLANECVNAPEPAIRERLLSLWQVMQDCVERGCANNGVLPGGLGVRRRAAQLAASLAVSGPSNPSDDPLRAMEWVALWALAVNEENAAGGRVVTAPTNGAAGIVPAVLHYYMRFIPGADADGVVAFLLTATAIGVLCKLGASISGAEVGCQGEVGSAAAMAAAGLAEVLGASPAQVENAAEIALEHCLGLTCDPVGGLVQIPCIERNAIGAIKAIAAARLALRGDGHHRVTLDDVIVTMRDTGRDMSEKYKETSEGGLALNVALC